MSEQHVRVSVGRRTLLTNGGDKKGGFRAAVLSGLLTTTIVCLGMGGAAAKARFVDLYNGEDFTGMEMMEPGRFEREEDGSLGTVNGMGLLWYKEKKFEDFILRVDWKAEKKDSNSGFS